jgi:arginyl-tRNA synthetase
VELSRTVLRAVRRAVDEGELTVAVPARAVVERPRAGGCGDYATGIALQLARPAGRTPREVAEVLREQLLASPDVGEVDITGPGFLNITLQGGQRDAALVRHILRHGAAYGYAVARPAGGARGGGAVEGGDARDLGGGKGRSAVQEVRLRVASGVRAAVVADAVARILRSQGVRVRLGYEDAVGVDPAWTVLGLCSDVVDMPGAPARVGSVPFGLCTGSKRSAGSTGAAETAPSTASAGSRGSGESGESDDGVAIRPVPVPVSADPLALGCDAGRWALLHPAVHDRARISDDHLAQRESNPLFLVRYAHARTRALVRNAADLGFASVPGDLGLPAVESVAQHAHPTQPATLPRTATPRALAALLAEYPVVLDTAARRSAPDRLARYLVRTGDAFLRYQETVPILPMGDEKPSAAHRARLALAEAAGTVLAGGLTLLGINAPDTL